ncbi:MAG: DUF4230 domain-containing protein [Butyricicoccus sp.]|nr:DUF4230 domain-containing protein [Butyricicoccus sp.]
MEENVREFPQAAQAPAPAQAQGEHRAAPRPQPRKKKKSKRARVMQRRLIVLVPVLIIFFIIFSLGSAWGRGRGTKLTNENVTAQLASLATLSSTTYHYTNVERFENVEDFYGWDASDYSSGFSLSYSGVITAAIDPTKIQVDVQGKTVTITLPEATVSSNEITQDSLSVYNSNQGEFVAIQVTDFAGFQQAQQPVAQAKATADGLLFDASDKAKAAAQSLIESMAGGKDKYQISIK